MKGLVKAKPETGIWMEDVPMPVVGPNDVLIKIKKTAICGTDIHIYDWDNWAQEHIKPPLVIGHEFVGEVVEIGKEVDDYFKIGARVSGEGHIACGHCRNCRAGRSHLCRINVSVGVTRNGCFAEFLSIPACNAYPLPDSIPDSQAAILDPFGNVAAALITDPIVDGNCEFIGKRGRTENAALYLNLGKRVWTGKPLGPAINVLHVVHLYAEKSIAAVVAFQDFILNVMTRGSLGTNQNDGG